MSDPSSPRRGVAVVTGGSAGVGRATVRAFADAGYDVAVIARGEAGLKGAVADVEERGRRALALAVDVADEPAVQQACDEVERELGAVDVWVNSAFVGALSTFWDTDPEDYRRMTDVTYFGQVHGTRAALRVMRPRDRGVVVNVSSALAHRGIPLQSAYCGAKHAVKGFTESVVTELLAEGSRVRVCLATLPAVNTPQFDWNDDAFDSHPQPVAPIFQPEVPARAIVELARHPRRDVWIGVSSAWTVLGNRIAPGFLDWYLGRTGIGGQLTDKDAPRYGANLDRARDGDLDHGAHGAFDDEAHALDPVSFLSRTVGRTAAGVLGTGLHVLGAVLDRLPGSAA